jgi:S-adenosylmethionine-diacylgycerolhomoserine-N-methlytransferase
MLVPGGILGVVDFHLPAGGGWSNRFWRTWFAHDGVRLSDEHLPYLRQRLDELHSQELRGSVPFLPGLRAPYYLFVGRKRAVPPA